MTVLAGESEGVSKPASAWVVLLIVLALFVLRVPLVNSALHGSELTTDEPDLTCMALDRYFGVPLTNTHWPALTNQMLMVPIIGVDFLMSGSPRSVEGFAKYAGTQYRDSTHLMWLHRWVMVTLVSLATLALGLSLRRHGVAVVMLAVLALQNVHLITYGTLGLGNGPALAAMIGIVASAMHPGCVRKRAAMMGLLFGLALASRNTSVLFVPMGLALLAQMSRSPREWMKLTLLAVGATIVGSAPAWTLALLEPVRWHKANLGNYVKVGQPVGIVAAAKVLVASSGWAFWTATLAAVVVVTARREHWAALAGWAVSAGAAVVISARSPLVESRYFDAIIVASSVMILLTFKPVKHRQKRAHSRAFALTFLSLGVLILALGFWNGRARFEQSKAGLRPVTREVAERIEPGRRVIVDRSILALVKPRASGDSLRALADGTERAMSGGAGLREFVERFGLGPAVAAVFASNLTEKEQNEILRTRAMAAIEPAGPALSIQTSGNANSARRYGAMSTAEALDRVRLGQADEWVGPRSELPPLVSAGPGSGGPGSGRWRIEPIAGDYVRVRFLSPP
jgi:hypothetical protein